RSREERRRGEERRGEGRCGEGEGASAGKGDGAKANPEKSPCHCSPRSRVSHEKRRRRSFATAFVVRCSRGLELEPRSKLHLERSSRVVVEQELSKCGGVRRFVCQAQEVYVGRPDKAAFWIVGH